jgi:hypothetical protein
VQIKALAALDSDITEDRLPEFFNCLAGQEQSPEGLRFQRSLLNLNPPQGRRIAAE